MHLPRKDQPSDDRFAVRRLTRPSIFLLRALVGCALLVSLFGQIMVIPATASEESKLLPQLAYLAVPYSILAILVVACVQVALVGTWMLLRSIRRDTIFTERALRWVDLITGAAVAATVLAAGVSAHLTVIDDPTDECASLLPNTMSATYFGAAFVLLMIVLRSLLGKATTMQAKLAEVG